MGFVYLTYRQKHNIYRIRGRLIASPTRIKTILFCMRSFFDCRGGYYPPEVVKVTKCTSVCCRNKKSPFRRQGSTSTTTRGRIGYRCTSVHRRNNDLYLCRQGSAPSTTQEIQGFALSFLQRVILSEQRVASRTFGFANDNIVSKSKSENCQDNFRDLLRFIFNLLA